MGVENGSGEVSEVNNGQNQAELQQREEQHQKNAENLATNLSLEHAEEDSNEGPDEAEKNDDNLGENGLDKDVFEDEEDNNEQQVAGEEANNEQQDAGDEADDDLNFGEVREDHSLNSAINVLINREKYLETSYGKSIQISDKKMYQQGNHYNDHGREMGYSAKKEYEQAARDFFEANKENCEIYEGIFNSAHGQNNGNPQIILQAEGKSLIIDKETGQLVDFYIGTEFKSFINVERIQ